jgi:hypothetical protein
MRLYLATWPEGWGHSKNPNSRFASGTIQWQVMMRLYNALTGNPGRGLGNMAIQQLAESRDRGVMDTDRLERDGGDLDNQPTLRVLLSYFYYRNVDLDELLEKYFPGNYPDIFADSGAFSGMTRGVVIDVEEYAEWLHRYKHLFSAYANLDVIQDAEATWENQQKLEDAGLEPVPAFHVLEDWKWLERYLEGYRYIALGVAGMQARGDAIMAWLTRCFQMAGERAVYHGFGLTSWQVMASFPWYSVDSSSWGQGFRYGTISLFDARIGRFHKLRLGSREDWLRHSTTVRAWGFDPLDFADRARNDRAKICAISALSYMRAEQWLRRHHGAIRIPGQGDSGTGPKTHLVVGAGHPDAEKGGNMSINALAQAGVGGPRIHLSDTGTPPGVHLREAGTKLFLAEVDAHMKDIRHAPTDRL